MPMLGIMASAISGNLWAPAGAYDSISTATVTSGGTLSVTFSSIPATYTHLQIRMIGQYLNTAGGSLQMTLNGDTATNYSYHYLSGDGASASASGGANSNYFNINVGQQDTTYFSISNIDLLDYANTNKYKTYRALTGIDKNGSGSIQLTSGAWRNTAAVTSITITPQSNTSPTNQFQQYSSIALYGIK
jgi:hypothetical protein